MVNILLVGVTSVAAFVFLSYSALSQVSVSPQDVAYETQVFRVRAGASASEIASDLRKAGLIRNEMIFRLAVARRDVQDKLQPGDYLLRADMSLSKIVDELQRGRVEELTVTVIEGWRAEEIANALSATGLISAEEFMAAIKDESLWLKYDFLPEEGSTRGVEGFLFPDTYRIGLQTTATEFVEKMLDRFDEIYTQPMRSAARSQELTNKEVVILASIVEREAQLDDERPRVAAVFLNRLKTGMKLQADPTVQYAVSEEASGVWWKTGLTMTDLAVVSPYNTYRFSGLPPAPIANPGVRSIIAVVQPAVTEDLFFVARGDGSHAFSKTLEEHQRNVDRYVE